MNLNLNKFIENKIFCETKKYSLIIGLSPSTGARSPLLWNKVYKNLNINCKMYPADITKKENLKKTLNILRKDDDFIGSAVTIPYKEEIIKYLDKVDKSCKNIGSVNTIIKKGNQLVGYNSDYLACKKTLGKFKSKKNILVLGAGGVGKSAIVSVNEIFKRKNVYIYNRNSNKIKKFITKLKNKKIKIIKDLNLLLKISNIDLIINATSVGFNMWQKNKNGYYNLSSFSPLENIKKIIPVKNKNLKVFEKKNYDSIRINLINSHNFFKQFSNCNVFEIIYDPRKTVLMKIANKYSKKNINGLEMNLDQAIFAFSIVNRIQNKKLIKKIMTKKIN